jgi:hypothetical protein
MFGDFSWSASATSMAGWMRGCAFQVRKIRSNVKIISAQQAPSPLSSIITIVIIIIIIIIIIICLLFMLVIMITVIITAIVTTATGHGLR